MRKRELRGANGVINRMIVGLRMANIYGEKIQGGATAAGHLASTNGHPLRFF